MSEKIVIGIDPGTQVTGFAVISIRQSIIIPLDYGCIRPPIRAPLSDRYFIIHEAIKTLLRQYPPHEMAIEKPFVYRNAQSAIKLGIVFGVALIAAKEQKVAVFGYSPREVKCAVVGTGKASKEQILGTIMLGLNLSAPPTPQDAADALAIALCHARTSQPHMKGL